MKDREIQALFKNDNDYFSQNEIEKGKRGEGIRILKGAAAEKRLHPAVSLREVMIGQLRFLDRRVFILQILLLGGVFLTMLSLKEAQAVGENGCGGMLMPAYMVIGTVFAVLSGLFAAAGYRRTLSVNIAELMESCYFNSKQNCYLNMAVYGGIDLCLLLLFAVYVRGKVERSILDIGIYLLVPFVIANCFYLGFMMWERGRKNTMLIPGWGVTLSAVLGSMAAFSQLYEKAAMAAWYGVFAAGVLLFIIEMKLFIQKVDEGEILCMS